MWCFALRAYVEYAGFNMLGSKSLETSTLPILARMYGVHGKHIHKAIENLISYHT